MGEVNEANAELWIPEPPSLLLITMIKYWHSDCTQGSQAEISTPLWWQQRNPDKEIVPQALMLQDPILQLSSPGDWQHVWELAEL